MTRTSTPRFAASTRRIERAFVSSLALLLCAQPSLAALTDLSPTPVAANAAVQAKPNIMLLMDTSGSMAWTHMPDEVEKVGSVDYTGSIGYRATQCNSIYYNPAIDYILPKLPGGTFFNSRTSTTRPTPASSPITPAPDATDSSIVNLSTSFRAFDAKTLRAQGSVPPDPAQPAYYYTYTGPQTLNYASPACRQPDIGATTAATGGGTWTRVIVSATSGRVGRPDERANFATWYSFYRTRISLIKTAASLAFTPLTDSFRVGLITVEPKTLPTDAAINPSKYVPIADFTMPQRTTWFASLFLAARRRRVPCARRPRPRRPALRRQAGRHQHRHDGDPVQFSCQQNFTIMTTDGYWNSQTETPGRGPVKIDGTTPVASTAPGDNPDGTLTPPSGLSPRPIFEGLATDISTTTDNTNNFSYVPCGTYVTQRTIQRSIRTDQLTYSTSQLVRRTVQTTERTEQRSLSTTRQTRSTLQHNVATSQVLQTDYQVRPHDGAGHADHHRGADVHHPAAAAQGTRRPEHGADPAPDAADAPEHVAHRPEHAADADRDLARRPGHVAGHAVDPADHAEHLPGQHEHDADHALDVADLDQHDPVDPADVAGPDLRCAHRGLLARRHRQLHGGRLLLLRDRDDGPTLVASCAASGANAGNNYVTTSCTSATTGPTLVASCTVIPADISNNYTATNCSTVTTGPTAVVSCTQSGPTAANSYTDTTCSTATSAWTPVSSCTTQLPMPATATRRPTATPSRPRGWVSPRARRFPPASPTPGRRRTAATTTRCRSASRRARTTRDGANNYTTTNCNTVTTGPTAVSSCTNTAASALNSWVTTNCTTVTTGPTPVASCSGSGATALNNWTTTTCPNVPSACRWACRRA
jgi:hypothetical protein